MSFTRTLCIILQMNDFFDSSPKEMMSESLRDVLPSEETTKKVKDSYISIVLVSKFTKTPIIGSLVGIELVPSLKIDIRIMLDEGFDFIAGMLEAAHSTVEFIMINYEEKILKLQGPYSISSTKIVEIDSSTTSCVLAVDMTKLNSTEIK